MSSTVEVSSHIKRSTFEVLVSKHGPLMKIDEVASLFHKSTDAIRIILSRDSSLSRSLNEAKNRYGRRIYFRTEKIADVVDNWDNSK